MPDMAIAADGFAHAVFVAQFFAGPIERYWATSSDDGVATAGVSPPDMLIVAPVTNGAASITVTASGPGGTATQTFTARVGAGATVANRSSAPQPPPPPPQPPPPPPQPPPAAQPPPAGAGDDSAAMTTTGDDSAAMTPTDDDLPPLPPDTGTTDGDALPTEDLPPVAPTAAPSLSGTVPAQTVNVGRDLAVDVSGYFDGTVQGWAVETSSPGNVQASMPTAGTVTLRGVAAGSATVTVTAVNDVGSVAQAFAVTVVASSTTTTTTAATATTTTTVRRTGSTATGFLVVVGDPPSVTVSVGSSATLDISSYFSAGAISYDVRNVPTGVAVSVSGSVATIRGVTQGSYTITLVARGTDVAISRPASVTVN